MKNIRIKTKHKTEIRDVKLIERYPYTEDCLPYSFMEA